MSDTPTGEPQVPAGATEPSATATPDQHEAAAPVDPAPVPPQAGIAVPPTPAATPVAAPEPTAVPTPAPAPVPDPRPKPEFGEYAPEGWEWKPEEDTPAGGPDTRLGGPGSNHSGGGSAPASSGPSPQTPATLQGVPHNLGAGLPRGSRRGAPEQAEGGAPYRAPVAGQPTAPQEPQQAPRFQAPQQGSGAYQLKPQRTGDRVITIVLLVFGAFGALQSALAMMGMGTTFAILADAPGIGSLTLPGWVDLTGKIVGMALLVLYGLVLVYSIRRMRAGKLTFWAPLAAGVLASITVVTIIASAMIGTPELMEVIQDPSRANELLEYLQDMQGM